MSFEGSVTSFGDIVVTDVRMDKLEGGLPVFCDDTTEFLAGFIVKNLMVNNVMSDF